MPSFSIDGNLTLDQTAGVQTTLTTDTGNDMDPGIVLDGSNNLDGLDSDFETFLTGLGLSQPQKDFAVLTDSAGSEANFIQVTPEGGESINDLKFVADSSTAVSGLTTLDNASLYLHVDATGNYATLTTSATDGAGRIVAAFALTNESVDGSGVWTAGVQMVTFEPINHPDAGNPDDTLPLTDALKIAADTAVTFSFDQLAAGNFLWAAVGDGGSAMLITGQDLNVSASGAKAGDIIKGGSDPSDAVNTSKASDTTIGINAQHFAPTNTGDGATGVFTFVTGYDQLQLATPNYTGQNINQIAYEDYINTSSASVFISQLTGGTSAKIHFSFEEAGGAGTDQAPNDLLPEEGLNDVSGVSYSYIGNHVSDSHLTDDTDVAIASVTIGGFTWNYNDATNGTAQGNITVTISGSDVIVDGAKANDTITFTALDTASPVDGTFNRIDIQALDGSAAFDIGSIRLDSGGVTAAPLGDHLFIDDDGPKIDPSNDANQPNDLQVANKLFADDPVHGGDSSFYILDPGTDGTGSFTIINPDTGDFTEDSLGAYQWTYDDSSHSSITGTFTDTNNVQQDLYTLVVNPDGTYEFDMIGTLPGGVVPLSSTIIHAGGPANLVDVAAKAPSTDFARILAGDGTAHPLVNASHGFVGVDNGNLDNGESLTLSLHAANGDLIDFSELKIGTKSAGTSHYNYTLHMSDGSDVTVTNQPVGKGGTIDVVDPDPNDNVLIETVTVTKVDGNAVKIGLGNIQFITPPDDVQLGFAVQLADGDSDVQTANFTVGIDGNNDGSFDATVNSAAVTLGSSFATTSPLAMAMLDSSSELNSTSTITRPLESSTVETPQHEPLMVSDHLMHV